MKIDVNKIPAEGLILEENISAGELDLDTELVNFQSPLKVRAAFCRITNAVTVKLDLAAVMKLVCGRCLNEYRLELKKSLQLNYSLEKGQLVLDIDPDIREEVILDYPIKSLCSPICKGLCPRCGNNLNEGGCSCATT